MTRLWLVRHGQTDWNVAGRWQGQASSAPGLNETGRAQARAARDQLLDVPFSAIYSSDLLRARQTAALIAEPRGLAVTLEPRLREIHLGDWEGLLSAEILARYPHELEERQRDPLHARAPGGETVAGLALRVLAAAQEIAAHQPDAQVLIVAHGVALAVILCQAAGVPLAEVYQHIPDHARPVCIQQLPAAFRNL